MFRIDCDNSGPVVVVKLSGTLGSENTEEFDTFLDQYIPESGAALLVELSQLESIDSSGLGAIIKLVTRARLGQGEVILVGPSAFVQGVLEATHLDAWIDICPTLEDAVERAGNG